MKKPRRILINRYGMSFGRTRRGNTYRGSGRFFADYYTHVCLRCGWAFKPPRHLGHRESDCRAIRAETRGDPAALAHAKRNLFGRVPY